MGEFIIREILELENYTLSQVNKWMVDYKLSLDSRVMWVSTDKRIANRYNLSVAEWDLKVSDDELNIFTIDSNEGTLLKESDDGDKGYLFIFME